jgi:signal transduction histidine kinase/ligand-binding sensor domain-containing protein/CheY-like chemotaxis protein/AraC-like DNA-binding protein
MRHFTLLLIWFILSGEIAQLQSAVNPSYYFSKINGELGLSHNDVKAIIQDSYGFMWFGTRNRLNRYDGNTMKVFDCYDPVQKKRNNNISTLFEDKEQKMWVGTDKGIFIFDPVYETFTFFSDTTANHLQIVDWVADIRSDQDHNIWIVIPNQGLFRYHTPTQQLIHYFNGNNTFIPDHGNPQCICIEQNGMVWVGTNGGGVHLYNKTTDTFVQYLGDKNGGSLQHENIYTICNDGDELVLGIHEGRLRKLNKRRNTLTDVDAPDVHYKIIRHVTMIDDELWVGTQSGLFIINKLENKVMHIQNDPMFFFSLSNDVVDVIYVDKEGGIWIGTRSGGLSYLPKKSINFECYVPMSSEGSISARHLREMQEDSNANIWIASEDAGLNIFDPGKKTFKRVGIPAGLSLGNHQPILGLLLTENQAYVGLFKNGMDIVQLPQFNIRHYSGKDLNLDEASIYTICEDRYGQIWIGNGWGVYRGNKNAEDFVRIDAFGLSYVYDIMEDSDGYIWVATLGNGVYKYDPLKNIIKHYTNDIGDLSSLSSNAVSSVIETSLGDIWFSTDRGGICRYNKKMDNFTSFSIQDGLPDDVAYKIIEDKKHNLWFGTNNGLVKFNPQQKEMKVFSRHNGLPFNEFNYKSALVGSNGKFYFGGLNGLIVFDPYRFEENKFIPPVYITQLTIYGKEIHLNTENSPLKKAIHHTPKITLQANQSNIGFEFVALSYTAPKANKYAYKMNGIDDDWTYTSNNHSSSYAKLPPGKYIFCVKGSNNDDLWNEEGSRIEIEILPLWWQSKIALTAYIICAIFLLYYTLNRYLKKTEKRHAEKQRLYETEAKEKLYNSKVEFFTNIVHEIRTPVTLINGPLESMIEMDIKDPDIKENLDIMHKNTSDLLGLINQLLDFRKVDSDKFVLNLATCNITEMLKDTYARFELVAQHKNKQMHLLLPLEDVCIPVDESAFSKILNNLLSNALRYSDSYIEIVLASDNEFVTIRVRNDGDLIPVELRERIFSPFYQVNKRQGTTAGSGIGLSLARSLSELHNGLLYYEVYKDMNEFVLKFPVSQIVTEQKEEMIPENDGILIEDDGKNETQHHGEIILIVEDNEDVLAFVASKLCKQFVVETALNGVDAMRMIAVKNIDLVLSDVMMPQMDGFELCKNIKGNLEYSHIPVVLLTAKNDLNSKIHGLEMGADAYVEKPFSISHLITQLTTLLNNRRREKEAFMRKPFLPIQHIGMNKSDEQFMQRIIDIISDHITDPNFNVESLSEKLFMSRSNMHRKIKALTELSSIDFIRLVRLRKAAELLRSGQYRTGEVCFLVGITSPSYFIKLFQKQFGMTPREFVKQHSESKFPI